MHLNKSYCFINCYVTTTTHNSHPYILAPTAHPAPHRPMGPGARVPIGTLLHSATRGRRRKKGGAPQGYDGQGLLFAGLRLLGTAGAVLVPRLHNGY